MLLRRRGQKNDSRVMEEGGGSVAPQMPLRPFLSLFSYRIHEIFSYRVLTDFRVSDLVPTPRVSISYSTSETSFSVCPATVSILK